MADAGWTHSDFRLIGLAPVPPAAAASARERPGQAAVPDVALFHLALEAGARVRRAPMRIDLAVAPRIIVDQAFERACRIGRQRDAAEREAALARMAARPGALSRGKPLHVAASRGGMARARDRPRRPDQPTILCTTLDQPGSRRLFRGCGATERMAPVHAGLQGCDAPFMPDEAHLSRACEKTRAAIVVKRQTESSLALPWGWTALTATPRSTRRRGIRTDAGPRPLAAAPGLPPPA